MHPIWPSAAHRIRGWSTVDLASDLLSRQQSTTAYHFKIKSPDYWFWAAGGIEGSELYEGTIGDKGGRRVLP
jgi:hypothetical protein